MKCFTLATILILAVSAKPDMRFKPPTEAERLQAIGPTDHLTETLARAFEPRADFDPIPLAQPGDWLDVHHEAGQTYDDFTKSKPNRPNQTRNKIYLQPLGQFPKAKVPLTETLQQYAACYFAMKVETLPPLDINAHPITTRTNQYTRKKQLLTRDILLLLKATLPSDAFCLLAVTMEDLYPDPSWNFVFGQPSLRERVGVYSFARYDPAFYGHKRTDDYDRIVLRRSCKVLAHETCHMFGMTHCIYFRCVLNGSNHLQESDARPMHLCPVCLRKLHHSVQFDVAGRYHKLREFYEKVAFKDEAQWSAKRLEWISPDKTER